MHEHIGDPIEFGFQATADLTGDDVGGFDGELGVDFDVEVDVELEAGAAGVEFIDAEHAGDLAGDGGDGLHGGLVGHGVDEVERGFAHDADTGKDDDEADGEATVVVGGEKALRVVNGEGDGDEGSGGGENIDGVVPGVGHEGGTLNAAADAELPTGHDAADEDRGDQGPDGIGVGSLVRIGGTLDGAVADAGPTERQDDADDQAAERFETAVAVGVVGIGGFGGHPHAEQY